MGLGIIGEELVLKYLEENNVKTCVYCWAEDCIFNKLQKCTRPYRYVNVDATGKCEDYYTADEAELNKWPTYSREELIAFQRGISCLLDSMEPMLRNGEAKKHVEFLEELLAKVVKEIREGET